ncbi:MAG: TRAP transporter small permease [Lachnospiraceae bacterium]|nr:TRAP transporter small permease [Lachnospiraceae bacterium]
MKKVLHWLDENLECTICMVLMVTFTVVLFIQVVMRYVFNNSLSWSEELARYIFIWMVFIGISYGAKQMKHLKIDVFLSIFLKKVRPYLVILADVIVLILSVVVAYSAILVVQNYMKIKVKSPALFIPY